MPRTKKQNETIRQATRDKIQAAASKCFAEKGLAGTNVQDIADQAGISIGLLYRHYKTKEALYTEIVDFALEGLKAITALFQSEQSPKKLIRMVTEEIYHDLEQNGEFVHIMAFLTQGVLLSPDVGGAARLIEQDVQMIEATTALIRRGQKLGEIKPGDPSEMAALYFSSIQGLGVMKAALKGKIATPQPDLITAHLF